MQCRLCQRVARFLHPDSGYRVPSYYDGNRLRSVKISSWEALLRNQDCPTCLQLAEIFNNEFDHSFGGKIESAVYEFWITDIASRHIRLVLDPVSNRGGAIEIEQCFYISPLPRGIPEEVGGPHGPVLDRS